MNVAKMKNRRVCAMPDLPPGRAYSNTGSRAKTVPLSNTRFLELIGLPRSGMTHTLAHIGDVV